jgi:glycosyltransferase involved in cell wall biosynthesis
MVSVVISAIVCTYNRYDLLPQALKSLAAQTLPQSQYEIIVVDNSPDHAFSREAAGEFSEIANLKWIIEKTPGLSNARNVGTRTASGTIVSFMDDDAIAAPDWLINIIAGFDRFGDEAAILGGTVKPLWREPRPQWLHDDLLGYLSLVDWGGMSRFAESSEWFAGTNISFRRSAIIGSGGFSTDLGRAGAGASLLSNDEIDLIAKIEKAGGRSVYDPDVLVDHQIDGARLTQPWFRRRAAWQATSDYILAPQARFERAHESWHGVLWFVNKLPPRDRSLRALHVPLEDPELFKAQLSAIYDYTIAILAGFNNAEL